MTIGERIANRRKELGMTQMELAQKLGYSSSTTIAKIENDANQVRQSKIYAIAKALDTTPTYIMGWEDPDPVDSFTLSTEERDFLVAYRSADNTSKEMVKRILDYGRDGG